MIILIVSMMKLNLQNFIMMKQMKIIDYAIKHVPHVNQVEIGK